MKNNKDTVAEKLSGYCAWVKINKLWLPLATALSVSFPHRFLARNWSWVLGSAKDSNIP